MQCGRDAAGGMQLARSSRASIARGASVAARSRALHARVRIRDAQPDITQSGKQAGRGEKEGHAPASARPLASSVSALPIISTLILSTENTVNSPLRLNTWHIIHIQNSP
eukprot:COSAG02_NODE_217_length_28595_cov_19.642371_16_plen_110_part_00